MDIFSVLPYDLQEYIYKLFLENKRLDDLLKITPIIIEKHFHCKNNLIGAVSINNPFFIRATLQTENDKVYMKCEIDFDIYIGYSYNMYNIPIGNINGIYSLIKSIKNIFMEYLRYNYKHGKYTFKNCYDTYYKIKYIDWDMLNQRIIKTKDLTNKLLKSIIKKQWFNNIEVLKKNSKLMKLLSEIEIDELAFPYFPNKYLGLFRIDDALPNIYSKFIRVPYSFANCIYMQNHLPIIYKHLEENSALFSPLPTNKLIRKLIQLKNSNKTCDEFNEELENIMRELDPSYNNLIIPQTGYAYLTDELHEIFALEQD
jgi:hypothetical protein